MIFKPLDGMGGQSIFRAKPKEHNLSVILENLTQNGQVQTMGKNTYQRRRHQNHNVEWRANPLARECPLREKREGIAGGTGVGRELNERLFICRERRRFERGLYFAGIDVIGDYLTKLM